jgi:integrase
MPRDGAGRARSASSRTSSPTSTRGIWVPAAPTVAAPIDPGFHEFASEWIAARAGELRETTIADYTWQLSTHLLPFFHRHRLRQITVAEVDRYREHKVREGVLSAESINKTITRLGQILAVAEERDLISRNPVRVNTRNRKLKAARKRPIYLDTAEQIAAILDAATDLDARKEARTAGRRGFMATLAFAGLRIHEAAALSRMARSPQLRRWEFPTLWAAGEGWA